MCRSAQKAGAPLRSSTDRLRPDAQKSPADIGGCKRINPHAQGSGLRLPAPDSKCVGVGGGVPIRAGNEAIGAVGVSGAPGGEKDEACANAGLAKVADALK